MTRFTLAYTHRECVRAPGGSMWPAHYSQPPKAVLLHLKPEYFAQAPLASSRPKKTYLRACMLAQQGVKSLDDSIEIACDVIAELKWLGSND